MGLASGEGLLAVPQYLSHGERDQTQSLKLFYNPH